jgi:hypothetical protein
VFPYRLDFLAFLLWLKINGRRWRRGWQDGGGTWMWRRHLLAWEEECVRECSVFLDNVVLQDDITNRWKWLLDPVNGYSFKGTYHFLTTTDEPFARGLFDDVWQKVLQHEDNKCVGGCDAEESACHLFFSCATFGSVWLLVLRWLGISFVATDRVCDHFLQFSHIAGLPRFTHTFMKLLWLACIWVI